MSTCSPSAHGPWRRLLAGLAVLLLLAPAAHADSYFEVYVGKRPAEAEHVMPRFYKLLTAEFHAVSPEALSAKFVSPPLPGVTDPKVTASAIIDNIELGYRAAARMQYDTAIGTLTSAIDQATRNEQVFVAEPNAPAEMMRALVQLGLSYYARGDIGKGTDAFAELARSLDGQPLKGFSDAAQQRYSEASKLLLKSQPGKVLISVSDPEAQIFLNGIGVGRGGTFTAGKLPGPYRALVMVKDRSLRYPLTVAPGGEARLELDWDFETALVVTPTWVGLQLVSPPSPSKLAQYVDRLADRTVGETTVATVTLERTCGKLGLTGRVFARRPSVKQQKVARVEIDESAPEPAMRALLAYMRNGELSPEVHVGEPRTECNTPVASTDDPAIETHPGRPSSWKKWTGVGLFAAGLVGGGLSIKYALDAQSAGDELQRVCAVTCTSQQARSLGDKQDTANRNALVAGVGGGVLAVTGAVLYILSRRGGAASQVSVAPTPGGAAASFSFSF